MKRSVIIAVSLILLLAGCGMKKDISVSAGLENLPVVTCKVGQDKSDTSNYQGYIDIVTQMSKKDADNLSRVVVRDIRFDSNPNGIAVMYRYNKPFDNEAVNVIYRETKAGRVYTAYDYEPGQFGNFGFQKTGDGEYKTKIQYLIMQVKPGAKKEEIRRRVTFTMVYEFKGGRKVEKPVEVVVPL